MICFSFHIVTGTDRVCRLCHVHLYQHTMVFCLMPCIIVFCQNIAFLSLTAQIFEYYLWEKIAKFLSQYWNLEGCSYWMFSSVFIGKYPHFILLRLLLINVSTFIFHSNIAEDIMDRSYIPNICQRWKGFVASANSVCRHCSVTGFYSRIYRTGTSSSFCIPAQRSDI